MGPDQVNGLCLRGFQGETLALEFDAELATWSMSPADVRVSGRSAGAPRECDTKQALGIPCHHAALKFFQRPRPLPSRTLSGSGSTWWQMAEPRVWWGRGGGVGARWLPRSWPECASGSSVPGRAVTSLHFSPRVLRPWGHWQESQIVGGRGAAAGLLLSPTGAPQGGGGRNPNLAQLRSWKGPP